MTRGDVHGVRDETDDLTAAIEMYYSRGWTDGLPVVPPTERSVRVMIDAGGLDPDAEITFIADRQVSVTAGKVAINAVLAGCRPEYMPVIIAAIEAIGDPRYNYHGPATSTSGSAVLILVNGPIARELGINCGGNLFADGWRANATIGRAVRLVMRNVIGTLPGRLDRSSLGHGGKYTFCIAENEAESPWEPVHVERGFRRDQSTVTVFAGLAPHQFANQLSNTADGVLSTASAHMRISAGVGKGVQYFLVIAGEHMRVIADDGYSKEDIRQFCFEHTMTSQAELKRIHVMPGEIDGDDEGRMVPLFPAPEDLVVVAAGGRAGVQSAYIPGWGTRKASESVTREIHQP